MSYSKDNVTGAAKELYEYAVNHSNCIDTETFIRYVERDGHFRGGEPPKTLKEFKHRIYDFISDAEEDLKQLNSFLDTLPEEASG